MADANTKVELGPLHDAIRLQIETAFTGFKTVEFYRDDEAEGMATPACLLELTETEPQPEMDVGTQQWSTLLRFEARIIMAHRGPATALALRRAATALATWLNLRRWGPETPGDPCQVIACESDEFSPVMDKFKVWRVEWVQRVDLGEPVWKNDGVVPEALYSWAPEIGIPHEGKYIPLDGGAALP